jgi:hypothetical protein
MAKTRYERRSFASSLLTYLQTAGWNITKVEEQFIKDIPLTVPAVGIHFIPSKMKELQMGRDAPAFVRTIQVDVYMESEQRAEAIIDDIGDFMDLESIAVKDKDSTIIAYMISDSDSILLEIPPLIATAPDLVRWRGIARATYEVNYID